MAPHTDRERSLTDPAEGRKRPARRFFAAATLLLAPLLSACGTRTLGPPVTVVPKVDLARYAGKWYEIAKYPNRFQRGCSGATAEYTLAADGKSVEVVNRCVEEGPGGKARSIRGKARVVDPDTNAKLKVTFFWPLSGDYWILALGPEYDYAVVGTPDRKYLWFLARTPTVGDELYDRLLAEAKRQGFDPARVVRSSPVAPTS